MGDSFSCTLVTPLYNERDSIEALWATVLGQSRRPDEWVITDNGSTDGTYEWLAEAARVAPFPVRVLSLPKQTIARMMNAAITEARGEVIACCHGGTRIPREWLENLLKPMADDPSVDVSAGVWEPYGEVGLEQWLADAIPTDIGGLDPRSYLPATRSMAFMKSVWRKVEGFPEWLPKFGEDTLFAIRLHAAGFRFAIARDARVGWRPKPTLKLFMRQERLYVEANTFIGLVAFDLRYLLRPWVLVPLAAAGTGVGLAAFGWAGGLILAAALPAAFVVLDLLRFRWSGRAPHLRGFARIFFWKWVLPLAHQAGYFRACRHMRRSGLRPPDPDSEALAAYLSGSRGGAREGRAA